MTTRRLLVALVIIAMAGIAGYRLVSDSPAIEDRSVRRVAVEVSRVQRQSLVNMQEFSGSLEPSAQLTVAPKIGGQVESVAVDIGDTVRSGDLLIQLDDDEYRQALAEAKARLQVARAQLEQAKSDAATASRTLSRVRSLNAKGIAATAELDNAEAEAANTNAALTVARATIAEAKAQVETARVRLGYTQIHAAWPDGDEERVVGERTVEPGDTVAANTPLLRIVSITPLTAVIQVPERLYTRLAVGQRARLRVAGAQDAEFDAVIERIAPVFDPDSRRARVELTVANASGALAPGMFVQVGLTADRMDDAAVVPRTALVQRGGEQGVFLVGDDERARFTPVEVAFVNGSEAAIRRPADLSGLAVTLGQAQLEDDIAVVFDPPGPDRKQDNNAS